MEHFIQTHSCEIFSGKLFVYPMSLKMTHSKILITKSMTPLLVDIKIYRDNETGNTRASNFRKNKLINIERNVAFRKWFD